VLPLNISSSKIIDKKMSHINLYIKKEGVLKRATVPIFVAKGLLHRSLNEDELETLFKRAVKEDRIEPYDHGLFYIDTDKKAVVSAQSDFTIKGLEKAVSKKLTTGWRCAEMQPEKATAELILTSTA
jgi:hypothetical protein